MVNKREIKSNNVISYIDLINDQENLDRHLNFYNDNIQLNDMIKLSKNGKYYHDNVISSIFFDDETPYILLENKIFNCVNDNHAIDVINQELYKLYNSSRKYELVNSNQIKYYLDETEYFNVLRYSNYYLYVCFSSSTPSKGGADKMDKLYKTKIKNLSSPFQNIIEKLQFDNLKLKDKFYEITRKY